jgi:hypothetical protein
VIKNLPANPGDGSSIPGLGRSLEKEMATTPIFLPGKSHEKAVWWATVHWVAKVRHDLATKQPQQQQFHSYGVIKGTVFKISFST